MLQGTLMSDQTEQQVQNRLFATASQNQVFTYYLDTELGDSGEYRDLIQLLTTASPSDTIKLFINAPGGYVSTAIQIANCILTSRAHVEAHLMGDALSAHALIALSCHSWVIYPMARLMIHTYRGGAYGKSSELESTILANNIQLRSIAKEIYEPFLTDDEIQQVILGLDLWFEADELEDRLSRVTAKRDIESQKAIIEEAKANKEQAEALLKKDKEDSNLSDGVEL